MNSYFLSQVFCSSSKVIQPNKFPPITNGTPFVQFTFGLYKSLTRFINSLQECDMFAEKFFSIGNISLFWVVTRKLDSIVFLEGKRRRTRNSMEKLQEENERKEKQYKKLRMRQRCRKHQGEGNDGQTQTVAKTRLKREGLLTFPFFFCIFLYSHFFIIFFIYFFFSIIYLLFALSLAFWLLFSIFIYYTSLFFFLSYGLSFSYTISPTFFLFLSFPSNYSTLWLYYFYCIIICHFLLFAISQYILECAEYRYV